MIEVTATMKSHATQAALLRALPDWTHPVHAGRPYSPVCVVRFEIVDYWRDFVPVYDIIRGVVAEYEDIKLVMTTVVSPSPIPPGTKKLVMYF